MGIFANPFFSLSGQKERLQNVADVLKMAVHPFDSGKIVGNTSSKTANAALSFVANNPYATAAIVAPVTGALPLAPAKAAAGSTAARATIAKAVSGLSTKTKVISGAAAFIGVPLLATSEKARVATIETIGSITPERLMSLGANTGAVIDNPTLGNVKDLWSENKGTLIAGLGAVAVLGGGAALTAANTYQNTLAIKENTKSAENNIINIPKQDAPIINIPPTASSLSPVPVGTAIAPLPAAATPMISTPGGGAVAVHRNKYKQGSFSHTNVLVRRVRTQTIKKATASKAPWLSVHATHGGKAKRYVAQKDTLYEERATIRVASVR